MVSSRRHYLRRAGTFAGVVGLGTAGCLGDSGPADRPSSERGSRPSRRSDVAPAGVDAPNVVLVVLDDAGIGDVGCYGGTAVETPVLDEMAAAGRQFAQAYGGSPVCAPSRSTLFDGRHAGRTAVRSNAGGVPIPDGTPTLSGALADAGYAVGGFGKWGLGDLRTDGVPTNHGFDTFFGYYDQVHAHQHYPSFLVDDGVGVRIDGYAHYEIVERTLRFLDDHRGERFFCYAPWTPPHDPFRIPETDEAWHRYRDRNWPRAARRRAAMLTMADRHVGALRDRLRDLGIAGETLLLVTSDNGPNATMETTLDANGGLRGHKRSVHEGGIRVPLLAEWPGTVPAGTTHGAPVYFPDLFPTLASLAGADAPADLDGRSIAGELVGGAPETSPEFLFWEWWVGSGYDPRGYARNRTKQAVRVDDWKLLRTTRSAPWRLYDLAADPDETDDVAASHPEVVSRLADVAATEGAERSPRKDPASKLGRRYRRPETFRTRTE